jgi:hypothetical protein
MMASDLTDVIHVENGNDGRIYLTIDSSVVWRILGDETKEIDGSSVLFTENNIIQVTGGQHHTNPIGAEYFDQAMNHLGAGSRIRDVMIDKEFRYRHHDQGMARRAFYIEMARRNLITKRPSKHANKSRLKYKGCNC